MSGAGTLPAVEPLGREGLDEAAKLHVAELGEEFVSRFGVRFMARYYRAFVEGEDARALCVREGGELVGVTVGATDAARHYSYLARRHGPALAFEALLAAARSPRLAAELVRTRLLRYVRGLVRVVFGATGGKKVPEDDSGSGEGPVGFAVYVAVRRGRRLSGTGRALLSAFVAECERAGAKRVDTAARSGSAGERFFSSLGWEHVEVRTNRSGERYALFTKRLHPEVPTSRPGDVG